MNRSIRAFTVVELMVVIAVIGILASITLVSYNGLSERAMNAAMRSDLLNFSAIMENEQVHSSDHVYPTEFPSDTQTSKNVVLQLTNTGNSNEYCVNAYYSTKPELVMSWSSETNSARSFLCSGPLIGDPLGGTVPTAPRGVNLVADFSAWTLSGGVTYNKTTKELSLGAAGTATSPLIKIDGSTSAKLTVDSYATTPSPNQTPNSAVHFGSRYYGDDGTTLVANTAGYTSNGNAQATPLSSWVTKLWNTPTGPNVTYVQFIINSSPTTYTSNNRIRNPSIIAL